MPDRELEKVVAYLRKINDLETKVSRAVRMAIDSVIAGRYTGRYSIEQLDKTEKTYIGTKVEHVLLDSLKLEKHQHLDTRILGVPVDIKFTIGSNWAVPTEAVDHLLIVCSANEESSTFRLGVVRATDERLNPGRNKDGKRTLNRQGKKDIIWLVQQGRLERNLLLDLPEDARKEVLNGPSGKARMAALFRSCVGKVIDGVIIETVGRQRDSSKRVRTDGGARDVLMHEGIDILSHYDNGRVEALGLPRLKQGQFMSIRLEKGR